MSVQLSVDLRSNGDSSNNTNTFKINLAHCYVLIDIKENEIEALV